MQRRVASCQLDDLLAELGQLRQKMMTPRPEVLDQVHIFLERIRRQFEEGINCPTGPAKLRERVPAIRRELAAIALLLESANAFFEGWKRIRACLSGGYNGRGDPVNLEPQSRLCAEG